MDASHLLSPVRPPTELADERFAISADLSDAIAEISKKIMKDLVGEFWTRMTESQKISEILRIKLQNAKKFDIWLNF